MNNTITAKEALFTLGVVIDLDMEISEEDKLKLVIELAEDIKAYFNMEKEQ